MKNVHPNSIETYHQIRDSLPKSRQAAYGVIYEYRIHGITAFQIAEILKVSIHMVTGRVTELMKSQHIRVKSVDKSSGRNRNVYILRHESDPLNKFPDKLRDFVNEALTTTKIDLHSRQELLRLIEKYNLTK